MRRIVKHEECTELATWKTHNPGKVYNDLDGSVRQPIRKSLLKEQHGLCAFCCDRIPKEKGRNAHLFSQRDFPQKSLEWDNIVVSCEKKYCCDTKQGGVSIPLTPLMKECEKEIKFYASGRIEGVTERAKITIKTLGLDDYRLCTMRRVALQLLAQREGCDPIQEVSILSDEEKLLLIQAINTPDEEEKLPSFAPVLVNFVKTLIDYEQISSSETKF